MRSLYEMGNPTRDAKRLIQEKAPALIKDLRIGITDFINGYQERYRTEIVDMVDAMPNYDNLDSAQALNLINKHVCDETFNVVSRDLNVTPERITYTPINKNKSLVFLVEKNPDPQLIAIIHYTIKTSPSKLLQTYQGVNNIILTNLNNNMLYIDVRCVGSEYRRRGLATLLIGLVLQHVMNRDGTNVPGIISSMNESDVINQSGEGHAIINGIKYAKHMKTYAGCHVKPNEYFQDILTAAEMVTKCLKRQCTDDDWVKYCEKTDHKLLPLYFYNKE